MPHLSTPQRKNVQSINTFLVDYSRYLQEYRITEPGKYELQYVIFSDNFRRSEGSFMLEIGFNMEVVRFNNRS